MADPVSIIAGTVVSCLVKVILNQLTSAVYSEFSLVYGAESHFRKLNTALSAISVELQDAKEK